MLTVNKLSVGTLSAISSDIGTINAGTITGITITGAYVGGSVIQAGSGSEVTLDNSGITLVSGNNTANFYKFSSGPFISANAGSMRLSGSSYVAIEAGARGVGLSADGASWEQYMGNVSLGTSGMKWAEVYINSIGGNGAVGQLLLDHESRLAALENA
jgi:hypothetical protein